MSAKIYTLSNYKEANSADEIQKDLNELIREMLEELDEIIVAAEEEHQNATTSGNLFSKLISKLFLNKR